MYGVKLKVPRERYEDRRNRLRNLIELKAPDSIIFTEALMVTECFEYGLVERFHRWRMQHCPHWVWWVCSAEFRQICRDQEKQDLSEFEEQMRKLLSCSPSRGGEN
jgi:hypothetical protein